MGTVGNNINPTLQSLLNNDYTTDPNFQRYQNQFNSQMSNNYQNNVLSPLANQGLMRTSGLQAATNSFNNTLADRQMDLYDNYYNRQTNNLSNLLNTSNALYNYMTGLSTAGQNAANAVNNYNMSKAQTDNAARANNTALNSTLASSAAGILTSDINAKQNIKKIGEKNGFNWYEFEYKDGFGEAGKHEGVIAQEVELIRPDAVIEVNGIKKVDYKKLGLESEVK